MNELLPYLTKTTQDNINNLLKTGIKFDKIYVNFITQDSWGGEKPTMTFTLIGADKKGDEIIFDRYEGNVPGFGQSFIFVNGEKNKMTDYLGGLGITKIPKYKVGDRVLYNNYDGMGKGKRKGTIQKVIPTYKVIWYKISTHDFTEDDIIEKI